MSSHYMSASGQRPLSVALNSNESTGATITAKQGDSVAFSGNSFDRVSILLPATTKIRRLQTKSQEGEWDEFIEVVIERPGGAGLQARFEIDDRSGGDYLPLPHTQMFIRRNLDPVYWSARAEKDGKIVEAGTLGDLLGPIE